MIGKVIEELGIKQVKNRRTQVLLMECESCKIHFEQTKCNAKRSKTGLCLKCSAKRSMKVRSDAAATSFEDKATIVHKGKFSYADVIYINTKVKVSIICPTHGSFLQTPSDHLNGYGCPSCAGTKKLTTEEFIQRAREVHGNKFDYSETIYTTALKPLKIICPIHGRFTMKASNHINQHQGCKRCAKYSDYNALYLWGIEGTPIYKIGVTSERLNANRIHQAAKDAARKLDIIVTPILHILISTTKALEIEEILLKKFTNAPEVFKIVSGGTEFRTLTTDELSEALITITTLTKELS